jgi:nicotinamidase-related amidase
MPGVAHVERADLAHEDVAGYPEVSLRNQSFAPIRESGRFAAGSVGTEVHPQVAPKPGDVVVTKHRVSAFAGQRWDP